MNIICDTNIWYQFNDDIVTNNDSLKATWVNIIEIATSLNLIDKIDTSQEAVKALKEHYSKIIIDNPFDY